MSPGKSATIIALIFAVMLGGAVVTVGQQSSPVKHEVWPEIDLYFPLNDRFRIFAMASEERSGEEGEGFKGTVGIHLDYFWKKRWTVRAGYHYQFRIGSGDPFKEHRVILEETYSRDLAHKFAFHDRNRQEFRNVNGDFSMRFRNRVRVEREFSTGKRALTPYGSAEIYYDTRFNTFNRYRLMTGVEFRFRKRESAVLNIRRQKTLAFYYVWQHDSRSSPSRVQAVGITFGVHF